MTTALEVRYSSLFSFLLILTGVTIDRTAAVFLEFHASLLFASEKVHRVKYKGRLSAYIQSIWDTNFHQIVPSSSLLWTDYQLSPADLIILQLIQTCRDTPQTAGDDLDP